MSKTSCAARCSRGSVQGVLRAPAEDEGGVAHLEDLAATASATLERSTGTVAHGKRAARDRRRRLSQVSCLLYVTEFVECQDDRQDDATLMQVRPATVQRPP